MKQSQRSTYAAAAVTRVRLDADTAHWNCVQLQKVACNPVYERAQSREGCSRLVAEVSLA